MRQSSRSLVRAWLYPECAGNRLPGLLVFLFFSSLIACLCWALGPYPITVFPNDTMHVLIQADFLSKGFRPFVDYHSTYGPFPFLFPAAAMQFYGVSLDTIVLSQILGAMLFGMLMFKIAASRLHSFWAILLSVSIELILVSCTPIGYKAWREFSCAMWYNSIGYSTLAIVFLYLLVPSRSQNPSSRWIDAVIVAFCLMACFLTKITFFAPLACVFVFGAVVFARERSMRVHALFSLTLAAVFTVGLIAALGGSIASYLGFLDSIPIKVHPLMLSFRFVQFTRTIGVFVLGFSLIAWFAYEAGLLKQVKREGALALLMLGSFLVSASLSCQDLETMPLLGVVPLGLTVLLVTLARQQALPVNKYLVVSTLFTALLLLAHTPKNSLLSWGFSHTSIPILSSPIERLTASELSNLDLGLSQRVDENLLTLMPKEWTSHQIAAISLLRQSAVAKSDVLFVAAIVSPINMLTDAEYPKGQVPWWPMARAEKPENFPLIEEDLLADTDWVLRDLSDDRFWRYLSFHRGDFLENQFEVIVENEHWMLYKRVSR